MSLGLVSQRPPMKRESASTYTSAISALTSPISNFTQLESPSAQPAMPPWPSDLAQNARWSGALVIEAPVQPGQWPYQPCTPGTPAPWLACSHIFASAVWPALAMDMYFSRGDDVCVQLLSMPSSTIGQYVSG